MNCLIGGQTELCIICYIYEQATGVWPCTGEGSVRGKGANAVMCGQHCGAVF